jgi:protein-disulfide isomerase
VLEQLLNKYPKEVNLIIKHYPLRMHKFARKASLAALAAARQDKYNEISRILFEKFRELNDENIRKYALKIGLDMQKFGKDYDDPSLNKIIDQDISLGNQLKVRGVPTLFVNGRSVKKRSLSNLSQMVEQELKKGK